MERAIPRTRPSRRQAEKPPGVVHAQSLSAKAHRLFKETVGHHQAKRFQQAEAGYDHILSQFPAHPDTLHLRGLLAYQLGYYPPALKLIQQAIVLDPHKPHYYFNQALVLEKEERWEEAVSAYEEAIRINPRYVEALSNVGSVYRRQYQWNLAITAYEHARKLKPQSADLLNNLGVVYK
ncbi:MAG: tetratricopeptide repeat protein [Nitrospirales bacterium]